MAVTFSTNDLLKALKIGRNTLRLYENEGLIEKPTRQENGYRIFSERHMQDLLFIKRSKEVGFTLFEIKQLLRSSHAQQAATCGSVTVEVSSKIQDMESEIQILMAKKEFLKTFLKTCNSKEKNNTCDILNVGFEKNACC